MSNKGLVSCECGTPLSSIHAYGGKGGDYKHVPLRGYGYCKTCGKILRIKVEVI